MAEVTDQDKKIIRQIEYYFGDINLPRDRFLQDLVKQDEGWVPLETMTKFNRLKQITDDVSLIAEALKKSTSGLMEISEDGTKLRRSPDKPMPENTEERRQDVSARTVYAKVFPLDSTLDELVAFFESYGPMETVFMRKDAHKDFKGSVFATFRTKDDMEKFLKEETVKYKDKELEARKTKAEYYKDKQEERKQHKEQQQQKGKQAKERQDEDHRNKIRNQLTKGAMLHMKGFLPKTKREDIKNFLQDYGHVAWVDFNTGDVEGWIRYDEENMASDVLEKLKAAMPDGIVLNDAKLECRVLEGEEELERWIKMFREIAERKQAFKDNKKSKSRGGGGGKQRYGKRPSKRTRDAEKAAKARKDDNEGENIAKWENSGSEGSDDDNNDGGGAGDSESPKKKAKADDTEAAVGEPPEKKPKTDDTGAGDSKDEPPEKKAKTDDKEAAAAAVE